MNHSYGRVAQRALERRRVQQRCPRGFSSAALGHRPQNRAKGADPRTGNLKGEKCSCPGVLSSPCPGLPVPGLSWFPGRWFSGPCPFGFLFLFVPPDVSFHWPRASRSSSQREGRRVKIRGTDPRTGTGHRPKDRLFQVSLYVRLCWRTSSRLCTLSRLPCSSPSSLLLFLQQVISTSALCIS